MPNAWSKRDERQYKHIVRSCRLSGRYGVKRCKRIAAATVNKRRSLGLGSLDRAEAMLTRGFREGNKSWIDVFPAGGRRMRITHELLGLSGPPPIPPEAKCIAWRYENGKRKCALRAHQTGFRTLGGLRRRRR